MSQTKLGLYALTLEFGALLQAFFGGSDELGLARYFIAHAGACALLAPALWLILPTRFKEPKLAVMLLIFGLAFGVPILGFAAVLISVLVVPRLPRKDHHPPFRTVPVPPLDPFQRVAKGFRQAGLRDFLGNDLVPVAGRMRALVALQQVPGRIASPLLRELLSDPAEDLRLLAYGLLERQEKRLSAAIHQELEQIEAIDATVRVKAARRLASLYWELVYQNLAQGDLRLFALRESLRHTQAVLLAAPGDAGMYLQLGRVLHELGRVDEAVPVYEAALSTGMPPTRVLPYLAELAYNRGDYNVVRSLMQRLHGWENQARLQPVIDFWKAT
jgi:tetratricopeptide (TPR) repeat protein